MGTLTGLEQAFRKQIGKELYDYQKNYNGFVSLLASMDNMWKVSSRFTRSNDIASNGIQVTYRAGLPTVTGVNAVTGSLASLVMPEQTGFNIVTGTMPWSHYHIREDIRKSLVQHLEKDPKVVVPYIKSVSKAVRDAVMQKLSEDMFPEDNCWPSKSAGFASGNAAENKVLSVPYPIQSGYVTNTPIPDATVYPYLVDDLNAAGFTGMKAINAGYDDTGKQFGTMTLSNLRRQIILPLRNRGGDPDLAVVDSAIYDYICTQTEDKIRLQQNRTLEYGGEIVRYGPVDWLIEERLDLLTDAGEFREAYFLQTEDWEFTQKDALGDFDIIQNPHAPALLTLLGYFTCGLVCKNTRRQGRAYDVRLS